MSQTLFNIGINIRLYLSTAWSESAIYLQIERLGLGAVKLRAQCEISLF